MPRRKVEVEVNIKPKAKKKVEEKDMKKELEDLLERMEKITNKIESEMNKDSEETKQAIENAKEDVIEQLNRAEEVIIFATEKGAMLVGEQINVCGALATMIHNIVEEGSLNTEMLIDAFVHGIADKDGKGICDREKLNQILEVIKEAM